MSRDSQHPWKRPWFAAGVLFLAAVLVASLASAAELDLGVLVQPVPMESKFAEPGYFVWCGAPTKGADGKYHLFYSRWPVSKGLAPGWAIWSEIAYLVNKRISCNVHIPLKGPGKP